MFMVNCNNNSEYLDHLLLTGVDIYTARRYVILSVTLVAPILSERISIVKLLPLLITPCSRTCGHQNHLEPMRQVNIYTTTSHIMHACNSINTFGLHFGLYLIYISFRLTIFNSDITAFLICSVCTGDFVDVRMVNAFVQLD